MSSKHDNDGLYSSVVEGKSVNKRDTIVGEKQQSQFTRMVVIDVISDPNNIIDDKKVAYWKSIVHVSNMKYANELPRNSIIAKAVRDDKDPMFVFPFFPSHLSLPCKAGETVWVMTENPGSGSDIAYWFCKIVEPNFVDDVNHTHAPRIYEHSMFPGTINISENTEKWHELRNGPVNVRQKIRYTLPEEVYLKGGIIGGNGSEDSFETILTDSDASQTTQYESVPRFRKRPGDVALEGTNNTLIVLGTDRVGPIANYIEPQDKKYRVKIPEQSDQDLKQSAGSIDIVVGRGQSESTSGKIVSTTNITTSSDKKGKEIHKELGKSKEDITKLEGDPDLKNDRSRVLISQRTKVDSNFDLKKYNDSFKDKGHDISDSKSGDAAIVIKTDKIRIIARSDVEIIVTGNDVKKSPDGQDIKTQKDGPDEWAAIVVATDGSIIFKPSKKGYIKLGSENASKALLCTDKDAIASDGNVSSPPVADTMGGFIGTSEAGQGTWAKKILVD